MAKKYTKAELAQLKKQVDERKRINEENRRVKLKKDAAIFYKWPGKVLKGAAIVSFVLSLLFFIDNFLPTSYHKHEIVDAVEERYDIMSKDGWHVICTYNHVYLNDNGTYDYFIHEKEYLKAKPLGYIEIAKTPIFHINTGFRVGEGETLSEKRIYAHPFAQYILPIFIMLFSLLWIPLKPEKNAQIIVFGYILMGLLPLLLSFFVKHTLEYRFDTGVYEMHIHDLELDQDAEE
jgi:hypothetical protein